MITGSGSDAASDKVGNGQFTKKTLPTGFKSRVEPKATVFERFLAAL